MKAAREQRAAAEAAKRIRGEDWFDAVATLGMESCIDVVLRMPYSVFNGLLAAKVRREKRKHLLDLNVAVVAQSNGKAVTEYRTAIEKADRL